MAIRPVLSARAADKSGMPSATEPFRRSSRRDLAVRCGAAVFAGMLIAGTFAPVSWWPLAVPGVALLVVVCWRRRARAGLAYGALAGLGTFIPVLAWLRVVGVDAWLALALLEAALFAPLGLATALVTRLRAWPVWVAALWVAEEAWRDRIPFGGFPWARLAFGQTDAPTLRYAAVGGAPLVTFAVALAGACLAAACLAGLERVVARAAGWVALGGAAVLVGLAVPVPTHGQSAGGPARLVVALVQGNVPHPGLHFLGEPEQVLGNHAAETQHLADLVTSGALPRPDVVIWPENSSDLDPYHDAEAQRVINGAVQAVGVPTLIGAVVADAHDPVHHVDNDGIVWSPVTGPGAVYTKQHPVPFGEYVPFRSVLGHVIGRLSLVPADFVHGKRAGVLALGPARIGDVICFEVAYDGLVRKTVDAGGRVIVVQTNNATYARTAESAQQLAISRLRAVEHGRAVLIAATSGISAVIAPDGHVVEQSRELTPALLVHRVPLRDSRTIADRLGDWPELGLTALGIGAFAFALWRRRHSSGEQSP
ncbi:MAG: apolipoprotein N-acyltransferase [Actinomycetes bacterium]